MAGSLYIRVGYHLPKKFKGRMGDLLKYANIGVDVNRFSGFLVIFGLELALALTLVIYLFFSTPIPYSILLFAFFYTVFFSLIILGISMIADSRTKKVELILPDALQLMSSNMRAGLIPSQALWSASRTEFGPLRSEIQRAAKHLMTGMDLKQAIRSLTWNIKSKILNRTVTLITEGIEGGGELSHLLEETAEDIRQSIAIREDIKASVRMYLVLVFIAAGIGSPVLFGISTFLIETITSFRAGITVPEIPQTSIPLGLGMLQEVQLDIGFLVNFSITMILVVNFFGSVLLGLISAGREKEGLRYIPVLMTVSLALFLATRVVMHVFFGSFLR